MASAKFAKCFPGDNGTVVCQHWNGSWIVFPGSRKEDENKEVEVETATSLEEIAVS